MHEEVARKAYTAYASKEHTDLRVQECGLIVDPKMPFLGASPDGLVSCKCCGKGVIETKCPFTVKDGLTDPLPTTFFYE